MMIIIVIGFSCQEKQTEIKTDSFKTLQKVKEKLKNLEYVLQIQGVKFDSRHLRNLNEYEKIEYLAEQLTKCRMVTHQFTKFDIQSNNVKIDSVYNGAVFLASYNENFKNKLILEYDNVIKEFPLNKEMIQFEYKIKPTKRGRNIYNGCIIQEDDTFSFRKVFFAY